jgi:erythromycin esterase
MGFNVFAIEASYPAALEINEYVLYEKGDRERVLANQGLWAWDTKEVATLIEWMREYNRTAPAGKKVEFVGFDMHNNELALDAILSYLQKVAPERVASATDTFKLLRPVSLGRQHFDYSNFSDEEKTRTLAALNELVGFLSLNRTRFIRQTSVEEFDRVNEFLHVVAQFADVYRRPYFDPKNPSNSNGVVRDYYMAENIQRLIERKGPQARFILWAHNDHIGVSNDSMGQYLRTVYGDAYYALGSTFNQGHFQAREMSKDVTVGALSEFSLGAAREGSIEWYYTKTGLKSFLIDYRLTPKDQTVTEWWNTYRYLRSIGLGYAREWKDSSYRADLKRMFDGMVFIENTTRAAPNPTGLREAWIIPSNNKK